MPRTGADVASLVRVKPRLAGIEIVVADMAVALAFYRVLGLDIPADADAEQHVEVDLGGVRLLFDLPSTITSFDPTWTEPSGGHRVALAFDCGTAAGVDTAWAAVTDAGYTGHLQPWDAFWGQRYAVVHDPDGTTVDLYANV
ncbi:glyoxalase [Rhodococcus sp. 05-2256-B2]|uniref:VOC family protein n=1 Tax=unclassified Rhodococcus (in: high G+C Gram-positive bacteria) TaxID=192944 RepID=UPI000B9A43AF|nr:MULTISPECIES: VOC family protein [unclassified Rhodococcus (in: high G+C Gram-positive bacteria)]OZD86813.1 glyoxalase [Rhodococcus sp. 05-2256-B4]OZD91231.1 glyoxalase [Rhodococcus sp. 05-2256-B2]OZD95802.1 glyoxalase [Rhodococcus sp. 05-2256-B1]OZD98722.1 glyoxalase [Rhodococcus sp. 05-2256-B3]